MSFTHINKTILTQEREPEYHDVAWLVPHKTKDIYPQDVTVDIVNHRYRLRHYMGGDPVWADLYVPVYWQTDIINMPYTVQNIESIIEGIHDNIENIEDRVTELETKDVEVNFVAFTDYLTRAYTIGTQYTTRLLAVENGQPTNNLTIANVVGCTIVSKTYIGNGFDIVFMPTAASFGFRAMLDSDNTVYADYNATATEPVIEVEELTYSDGTKAVTLHAMTLTNTPSVALRTGAGNITVTTIAYEELDTDNTITIP